MRNISNYEIEYNKELCEEIWVSFRRKKVLELLKKI